MQAKVVPFSLAAAVAVTLSLAGCGGGGGGNDPVTMTSTVAGSSEKDMTIKAGDNFSFNVVADSPDNALKALAWTVQASANAPVLAISNMDCATAEKVDTPRQNGLVSSLWKCTISGAAPKLVEKDATYSFTANATNSKGSAGSASSVLKVLATPSDALVPKVKIDAPTKVTGGDVKDLTCSATGGFVKPGETAAYSYAWSSSIVDGQKVAFDNSNSAKVKATFPKLGGNSTMIVNCEAQDGAGNAGQASVPVEVEQASLSVSVSGAASGISGQTIAMECSVAGDAGASKYTYKWSSIAVGGASLAFAPSDRSMVSVTLPNVTTQTSLVATCEVTDEVGSKGQASKAVDVAPPAPPAPPATGASGA